MKGKTVQEKKHHKKIETVLKVFLIILIMIYPLAGAFLGLDLGDTGYHLFAFENLASNPEKINCTTFFTTVIGYLWDQAFGELGLLAFNFLEVLLEWSIVIIVYITFKNVLGKTCILLGSFLSIMAADTYLNIFNYHQFNAFLLIVIICLQYKAIIKEKFILSFLSGMVYMLLVFSRVGSVVAAVTFFLYLYDTVMHERSWKTFWKHVLSYAVGAAIVFLIFAGALVATNLDEYFINNIFRLSNIASDNSTAYGFYNLLYTLVFENMKVMASGFIYVTSIFIAGIGVSIAYTKTKTKMKRFFCIVLGLAIVIICAYEMFFAYDINPAETWPQMTTGPRFVIGVMYVFAFLFYAVNGFKNGEENRKKTLMIIGAYLLVVLTIAGSNTGTKHIVLGLWLMGPVFVAAVKEIFFNENILKAGRLFYTKTGVYIQKKNITKVFLLFLVMFMAKFMHMIYYTFNYDSVNRLELTATVNSEKVRGILTTQREADSINGVLEAIDEVSDKDQPLMVFGSSLLFYYMTDKESYTTAWVTPNTYSLEQYQADLASAKDKYGYTLHVVLFCRTNYSYGFDEETLEENYAIENNSDYGGKKEQFISFLWENNYDMEYINDYYMVLVPGSGENLEETDAIIRGVE